MTKHHEKEEEPHFIEEHQEFIILKKYVLEEAKGAQKGHLVMGMDVLKHVLFRMYQNTSYGTLVNRSSIIQEAEVFSTHLDAVLKDVGWQKSTCYIIVRVLKKILSMTSVDTDFTRKININVVDNTHKCLILPKKISTLPDDNKKKILLYEWIGVIKKRTNNKSAVSLKNIMYAILGMIPKLQLSLDEWPDELDTVQNIIRPQLCTNSLLAVCGDGKKYTKKLAYFKIFLKHIVKIIDVDDDVFKDDVDDEKNVDMFRDTADKHRISVHELELLYKASTNCVRDELMYLLLITTGMRVGGLVKIKTEHLSHVNGKNIDIKDTGRTLEKGNKWFTFVLNPRIKTLLYTWIMKFRMCGSSPYLFPSNGIHGHITTNTVRTLFTKWCKESELQGSHLHPHALRHSYAHILLETGNSVDIVSKLLGHANTSTTEHFYLKENASDVAKRANIPWLDTSHVQEKIIPNFLDNKTNDHAVGARKNTARKKLKSMARMIIHPKEKLSRIAEYDEKIDLPFT
jgi:integrase